MVQIPCTSIHTNSRNPATRLLLIQLILHHLGCKETVLTMGETINLNWVRTAFWTIDRFAGKRFAVLPRAKGKTKNSMSSIDLHMLTRDSNPGKLCIIYYHISIGLNETIMNLPVETKRYIFCERLIHWIALGMIICLVFGRKENKATNLVVAGLGFIWIVSSIICYFKLLI